MLSVAAYRLVTLAVMGCLLSEAHALDPHRKFSQYVREKWSAANGLPGGAVHAIAQSPDGYLWIGTDKGLVRFDGFTFLPVPPKSLLPQNDPILGLITDAEGDQRDPPAAKGKAGSGISGKDPAGIVRDDVDCRNCRWQNLAGNTGSWPLLS